MPNLRMNGEVTLKILCVCVCVCVCVCIGGGGGVGEGVIRWMVYLSNVSNL